ncbi:MAG TPA: hypothetical protein VFJ82_26720 [Longimicrobium sp.]|nr:hypothetical protein [Longimicrobium sp.]
MTVLTILSGAPAAVVALTLGLGCAAAPRPAAGAQASCAAEADGMRIALESAAPAGTRGTVRTAACRLPEAALARARAASSAVLRVEGVRTPASPVSVLVFLNDPQADASTRRPSYAGSFTLLAEGPAKINAQVALGAAVAHALRERGDLSVTLVAVDREDRPVAAGLAFDRLVLDLR